MQLANGYVFYISPSYFEFAGNVSRNSPDAVTVSGSVKGALDTGSGVYNLAGYVQRVRELPLAGQLACTGPNAIVSSAGIGACGKHPRRSRSGFRYAWGGSSPCSAVSATSGRSPSS